MERQDIPQSILNRFDEINKLYDYHWTIFSTATDTDVLKRQLGILQAIGSERAFLSGLYNDIRDSQIEDRKLVKEISNTCLEMIAESVSIIEMLLKLTNAKEYLYTYGKAKRFVNEFKENETLLTESA